MALVLVKEDGTGKADAKAYADAAQGDAFHEGHLYATAWTAATAGNKAAALVMATRVIDSMYRFNGTKATAAQALQWPREDCPDPDAAAGELVADDDVPAAMVAATCELARELLIVDRTAAPPGEGVLTQHNADFTETVYSKPDTRPMVPRLVQAMLAPYGAYTGGGSSTVKLTRV